MKRIVLLLVMLFMAHVAESANVLWNKVTLVRTLDDPNVFSLAWVDTKWGLSILLFTVIMLQAL